MKQKSRAILFIDGKIVLIKREKNNSVYYVFPGGSVEEGETTEEACIRELVEELGIKVTIDDLLFELTDYVNSAQEVFYSCTLISGIIGSGQDKKFMESTAESTGYSIASLQKEELKNIQLLPLTIRDKVIEMK